MSYTNYITSCIFKVSCIHSRFPYLASIWIVGIINSSTRAILRIPRTTEVIRRTIVVDVDAIDNAVSMAQWGIGVANSIVVH